MASDISIDMSDTGSDVVEGGLPAVGEVVAVMITGAFINKSEAGNTYGSFNGEVVAPAEYFGVKVKKSPIMLRTTADAQKAKHPAYSAQMAQVQAGIMNKNWPTNAAKLFSAILGEEAWQEALSKTGGRLTKETMFAFKGACIYVPVLIDTDNRDGSKFVTFNIVKERTSIDDLGLAFEAFDEDGGNEEETF